MIVTLTLNPCVDLSLEVEDFAFGEPMRALGERRRPGGKGINVSAVLRILGVPSTDVVPLGGPTGREFIALSRERGCPAARVVRIAANTRTNIVLTSRRDGRFLKVNQQGGTMAEDELGRVFEALDALCNAGDYLVLAGGLPPGAPNDAYARLIRRFHAKGCRVALDADLAPLQEGLKAGPDVIKPNRQELQRAVGGGQLDSEEAIIGAARRVVGDSDVLCAVTGGSGTAYLVARDLCLRGYPPPAAGSPVGAGDAFLAGLVKVLSSARPPYDAPTARQAFALALACGSAAASTPDTEYFTPGVLGEFLERVKIDEIRGHSSLR